MKAFFDRNLDSIEGFFTIQDELGNKLVDRVPARSGQAGHTRTSWKIAKSPIPFGKFNLHLKPNNQGQKAGAKGIGEFYPIDNQGDRMTILSPAGSRKRTEIGLHEENIFKGSSGCIVIVSHQDWLKVQKVLGDLRVRFNTIPLEVL